jgi:preprotein translocase subunit SecD
MIKSFFILLSITSCLLAEPALRISKVAAEKGEGVEQMVYAFLSVDGEKHEDVLLIYKAAIVTEADVEEASAIDVGGERGIAVKLTEAEGVKLGEASRKLQPGANRLAIILDGKFVSAPVVMMELGRSLVISGLNEYDDKQFIALIKRLNGQPVP